MHYINLEAKSSNYFLFKIDMWPKEAEGKYCYPYVQKHNNDQIACQSLCLESATCVGISFKKTTIQNVGFSFKKTTIQEINFLCLLCNGDELRPHRKYAFYKRPGNTYIIRK